MIHTKAVVIGLCAVYILLTQAEATPTLVNQTSLINGITNVVFHNDRIYITGDGTLSVLDNELTVSQIIVTCDSEACQYNNVNKILLIKKNSNELIMCGGYNGKCQARPLSNLSIMTTLSTAYLVSNDSRFPAVGLITIEGKFTLAVTIGNDYSLLYNGGPHIVSECIEYKWANSYNGFVYIYVDDDEYDNNELCEDIRAGRNLYGPEFRKGYWIYFKDAFQTDGFSYFVTNQKRRFGDFAYVSKFIRIRQNDESKNLDSYKEVQLSCINDGVSYNLIQKIVVVNTSRNGKIFVAAFTKGIYPENPSGDSVICYTTLNLLDGASLQASPVDYGDCIDKDYRKEHTNECFSRLTGNLTVVNLTLGIRLPSSKGYITTMSSRSVGDDLIDIHAGTDKGNIIKMTFIGMNYSLTQYAEQVVGLQPIVSIHNDGLYIFITTTRKVYKYKETNCSEYTTCEDTMAGRNPVCGWCVYKRRSTLMTDCYNGSNNWLTSTGKCSISLQAQPKGKSIHPTELLVSLNAVNCPVNAGYTDHFCKYKTKEGYIDNDTHYRAQNDGIGQFTCITPNVTVHTDAIIELWATSLSKDDPDILLAHTTFLFYDCSRYTKCKTCTTTVYTDCRWCSSSRTCTLPTGSCDDQLIQNVDTCPQLISNSEYFVPNGIEASVILKAKHLHVPSGIRYTYTLPSLNISNEALQLNETSVLCNINISTITTVSKVNYHIELKYGNHSDKMIELDDDIYTVVTVYRCENLAKDCTRCGALNSTRYQCGWCNDKCGYTDGLCNQTCPPPVITKIVPHDGPWQGGTRVTMFGTDIGVTLSDIKNIHVGSADCTDIQVYLDKSNLDYSPTVIHSISCETGPMYSLTLLGRKVPVKIQVMSQVGGAPSMFTFQQMLESDVRPREAIESGGTLMTLYGQHLGIGNRKLQVEFNHKLVNAQVYSSRPLNVTSDSTKATIQFIIPPFKPFSKQYITIELQNKKGTQLTPLTRFNKIDYEFSVLRDPVIHEISPKRGFFSGGTLITIMGTRLNHAQGVKLLSTEGTYKPKEEKCAIKSGTKAVCKVPPSQEYILYEDYQEDGDIFVNAKMVLAFDGMKTPFDFKYYQDPFFESVQRDSNGAETNVIEVNPDKRINIKGKRLNLIPKQEDISVTIGIEKCTIEAKNETIITCIPPNIQQPIPGALYSDINVTIGNIRVTVGYVKYEPNTANAVNNTVPSNAPKAVNNSVPSTAPNAVTNTAPSTAPNAVTNTAPSTAPNAITDTASESTNWTILAVAVGVSIGVVVIAAVPVIVIFKRTRKRFKKTKRDTANQHIQMQRMLQEAQTQLQAVGNELTTGPYAVIHDVTVNHHNIQMQRMLQEAQTQLLAVGNELTTGPYAVIHDVTVNHHNIQMQRMLQEAQTQLLAVGNELTTGPYAVIDDVRSTGLYEEIDTYHDIQEDYGYRDIDNRSSSSSYADVLPANANVEVYVNRVFDNRSSTSSYADVQPANENVEVHANWTIDNRSSSSSYADVLPANENVEVHDNRAFENECSSSSYLAVLPANERVVVTNSDSREPTKTESQRIEYMSVDNNNEVITENTLRNIAPNIKDIMQGAKCTYPANTNKEDFQNTTDNTFNILDKKEENQD